MTVLEKRFSINGVVLFKNSEDKKTFGIIMQLLEKNQCLVRTTLYGKEVFRPSEWSEGFPVETKVTFLDDSENRSLMTCLLYWTSLSVFNACLFSKCSIYFVRYNMNEF
jgi:hypothetical protein